MQRVAICCSAALAFLASGCSALGLDRIPIPVCETSEDCRLLNDDQGIRDTACQRYFCVGATTGRGTCRLGPEDFDGDGVPKCSVPVVDCADHDASVFPDADEIACDGIDQDCDSVIDDEAFALTPTVMVASLGDVDSLSFAPGASGVSAIAWTDGMTRGATVATLGTAASAAPTSLAYRTNSRGSSAATDGIRTPAVVADAAGCMTRGPAPVSCPGAGATCNGPGADRLPWLGDLPGDGHVCVAGVCDACVADTDCGTNTLPRTCNRTADASACSPGPVGSAPELSAAHCCAGQLLDTVTSSVGGDPAACCVDRPRTCRVGICRDSCDRDEDCPLLGFQPSVTRPIFGVCVDGACVPPDRPDIEGPAVASCNFDDLALDRVESNPVWVVASLSARGCADGQLRLGVSTGETPSDVLALGPESRSDVFTGVDVDVTSGGCTGASRAGPIRGASQPAVSAVAVAGDTSGRGTGLVAYLARPASGLTACATTTAFDVEALGTYFAPATATEPAYVHASDGGIPVTLGRSAGVGRPAIAAISDRGWIVGFGSAVGTGVDLRIVRALDPLPELSPSCASSAECGGGTSCVGAAAGTPGACRLPCTSAAECGSDALTCCVSAGACRPAEVGFCVASNRGHVSRPTTSLPVVGAGGTLATDEASDRVQLAGGALVGDVADIGIVWQTGCDASARVWFARAHVDVVAGTIVDRTDAIAIGAGSQPTVAYVEDGVLVPGRVGPGGTADETNDGGFVVVWTSTDGHLLAVRVAELGGVVVDGTPLQLDDPTRGVPARIGHLFTSTSSGSRLEYAYAESGTSAAVLGGMVSCRATP